MRKKLPADLFLHPSSNVRLLTASSPSPRGEGSRLFANRHSERGEGFERKLLLLFLILFITHSTHAQIPTTLSYQGLLTDASGTPVADGKHNITFKFYDASAVLKETRIIKGVDTFKGLFTQLIGDNHGDAGSSNAPLPYTIGNEQYNVGIEVDGGAELSPRVKLTTMPYAFKAQSANTMDATGLTGTVADARLSNHLQDLADGSLTGSKVGTGINASNITTGTLTLSGTDAARMPNGTTAQRPASPAVGSLRFNTTLKTMEFYNGTNWSDFMPVGTILAYGGTTLPDGYLWCDGAGYSITGTYANLFSVISSSFGFASGMFNVPDLRGRFMRGVSGLSNNDPEKGSRGLSNPGGAINNSVGSLQGDQTGPHNHKSSDGYLNLSSGSASLYYGTVTGAGNTAKAGPAPADPFNIENSTGSETRPKNVYVNFIIKY